MFYRAKSAIVDAIQMPSKFSIEDDAGGDAITGYPGDWMICDADGDVAILPDALFRKLFSPEDRQLDWVDMLEKGMLEEGPALTIQSAGSGSVVPAVLQTATDIVDAAARMDGTELDFPDDLAPPDLVASGFGSTVLDGARSLNAALQAGQETMARRYEDPQREAAEDAKERTWPPPFLDGYWFRPGESVPCQRPASSPSRIIVGGHDKIRHSFMLGLITNPDQKPLSAAGVLTYPFSDDLRRGICLYFAVWENSGYRWGAPPYVFAVTAHALLGYWEVVESYPKNVAGSGVTEAAPTLLLAQVRLTLKAEGAHTPLRVPDSGPAPTPWDEDEGATVDQVAAVTEAVARAAAGRDWPFPWAPPPTVYDNDGPPPALSHVTFAIGAVQFRVGPAGGDPEILDVDGLHTGRLRYRVECLTCKEHGVVEGSVAGVVHPATTGASALVRQHLRDVHDVHLNG